MGLDQLNENTNETLDFFAVNIQLWKIDNSNPAPKFEIIVSPNEWTKTIRSRSQGGLSETKLQQLDFWTRFKDYSSLHFKGLKLQKPNPQHWYNVAMGSSEAHISLTVNTRENTIGCEVYIPNNKEIFYYLKDRSKDIESKLNIKLEWIEATKASRIKTTKGDSTIGNSIQSNEIFDWFGKMTIAFQKHFSDLIKEYTQNR